MHKHKFFLFHLLIAIVDERIRLIEIIGSVKGSIILHRVSSGVISVFNVSSVFNRCKSVHEIAADFDLGEKHVGRTRPHRLVSVSLVDDDFLQTLRVQTQTHNCVNVALVMLKFATIQRNVLIKFHCFLASVTTGTLQ